MPDRRRRSDRLVVLAVGISVLAIVVTGFTSSLVLLNRSDIVQAQDVADSNRDAIKRACEVLNYAIARSTPKRAKGLGPTPTELYIAQLVKGMSEVEQAALARAVQEYPPLGPADCDAAVTGEGDPFPKPQPVPPPFVSHPNP